MYVFVYDGNGVVTHGAPANLVLLAVMVFVVGDGCVADHGHDVRKDDAGALVLVRVDEDTEAFKPVHGAEDGADLCALLREPDGHAVAVQAALAVDLELDFDL